MAAGSDPVVATVGSHKFTESEIDAKIKPQLASIQNQIYELKKQAAQSLADDYLIEQAAKKENLSSADYLAKHLNGKKQTEADAKQYYDQHKELQTRFPKFDVIKDRLTAALENQNEANQRQALLEKLRAGEPVTMLIKAPRIEVKSAGHPELGPAGAPVTIVEFSDFQCPFCRRAEPSLNEVRQKYGDKVRLVYLDFPLSMHPHSMDAAMGARCAADQGKFWPFHDLLFADQSKLAPDDLKADAKKLGLDTAKFDACLDQAKYRGEISADLAQGQALGVDGTPAFFINGRPLSGAVPLSGFASIIDDELSGSAQKQARAN